MQKMGQLRRWVCWFRVAIASSTNNFATKSKVGNSIFQRGKKLLFQFGFASMQENDPLNTQKQWFALYTNPRAEKSLSRLFKKYKIDHYLPLIKERKKWSDRFKIIETPRLKSYIFVNIIFWKDKVTVLQLPGAHHFVFAKGVPAVLEEEEMEKLKDLVENYGAQTEVIKNEALQPGKIVKITEGPFAGRKMEIIKRKNDVTLILRFPSIDQAIIAEMSIDKISWEETEH